MMTANPASFSHPAWMRAVVAQLPGAAVLVDGTGDLPFRYHAVQRRNFPLPHVASYITPLTPSPLPAAEAVPSVDEAVTYLDRLAKPLVMRRVPVAHAVTQSLVKAASQVKVLNQWERAALDVTGSFDAWLLENFDHKRRKELKRLKARLAEQGVLTLDTLGADGALASHIDAFLALEAGGWKGRRGSAINLDPKLSKALRHGLAAMHALGKVRFWTFRLDGRPIATLFALVDGGQATLGKIAYDEAYARYSPGVLLIIAATESLFSDPVICHADGNAIPGHPMIDRIWRDRVLCMDVVIASGACNPLKFKLISQGYGTADALRGKVKQLYLTVTGRRPS